MPIAPSTPVAAAPITSFVITNVNLQIEPAVAVTVCYAPAAAKKSA